MRKVNEGDREIAEKNGQNRIATCKRSYFITFRRLCTFHFIAMYPINVTRHEMIKTSRVMAVKHIWKGAKYTCGVRPTTHPCFLVIIDSLHNGHTFVQLMYTLMKNEQVKDHRWIKMAMCDWRNIVVKCFSRKNVRKLFSSQTLSYGRTVL